MKKVQAVKVRHILCAEKAKIERAREEIVVQRRPFNKVAEEYSEDKARRGGLLGWITRSQVVPEFAEAAFALPVSTCAAPFLPKEILETRFGFHLLIVEERK